MIWYFPTWLFFKVSSDATGHEATHFCHPIAISYFLTRPFLFLPSPEPRHVKAENFHVELLNNI